jgi:hypothetical protein|tara:strand:- start:328 stop:1494 length:1167 start_codon:yes stop_codon:yes gene_type:complete
MSSPNIRIKRSAIAGKVPHYPDSLALGEFAINTADGKVFIAAGVGAGVTVREVGISTENILSGISTITTLEATSLTVDNTIVGISSGGAKVDTASDAGNQWHHVGFLDNRTGFQKIKTNGLTYNPNVGKLYAGIGSFGKVTGEATVSQLNVTGITTVTTINADAFIGDGSGLTNLKIGAATSIACGVTTATQGQTAFSTLHPHNDGTTQQSVEAYINGIRQRKDVDFSVSSTSTVTLTTGATVGDEVSLQVHYGHTIEQESFTATQGQTVFTISGGFSPSKNIKVFLNGVKLRKTTDYTAGASIVLTSGCKVGDEIDICGDASEEHFTATQGQTAFVPTDSNISRTNSQVFLNGVLLRPSEWSFGDTSIGLVTGATLGDEIDVVVRRS